MIKPNCSALQRNELITTLKTTNYDLVVIGGGITGAGIALDAALRGLKVALIEKNDFAWGTSSRSTKLIHGGLRYLKQLEVGIVMEVGKERAIVYGNAPHIVVPEKMLLPIIKNGSLGKRSTSLGLMVYDRLAGVKKNERRYMLNKQQTIGAEPLLNQEILKGGGMYYEYRSDDARLTIEIIKTAVEEGALCLNYIKCIDYLYENDKIVACKAKDVFTGEEFVINTKKVINATGPWVDTLRKKDNSLKGKHLQLTKGVHIVVPKEKLPILQSVYFDVQDGRMIFAIPRQNIVYIGTTDTVYNQDINEPFASKEDVEYIIKATNHMFPTIKLATNDVISTWSGLRPLIYEEGKSASELSRKDEIFISDSGLISIAGGKLTGYRKMAQRVVDVVCNDLAKAENRTFKTCSTKNQQLSGGNLNGLSIKNYATQLQQTYTQFSVDEIEILVHKYGCNTNIILDYSLKNQQDLLLAEAWYCLNYEFSFNINDFYIRRTGRLYFERPTIEENLEKVHEYFTNTLQTNHTIAEKMKDEFTKAYNLVLAFKN